MTLALVCVGILLPHAALVWRWSGRWSALAWLMISTALVIPATAEMLGQPKPLSLEWRDPPQVELVGLHLIEGEAIYLWVLLPDATEPHAYVLPWSKETAERLYRATEHGPALIEMGKRQPHPIPVPPLPPKDQ